MGKYQYMNLEQKLAKIRKKMPLLLKKYHNYMHPKSACIILPVNLPTLHNFHFPEKFFFFFLKSF